MGNVPHGPATAWRVIGRSVRGASHVRSSLPNQDAIAWYPESGEGPPLIVAVSDGHGSPRNFRSDVGSKIAVAETTQIVHSLLVEGQLDPDRLSAIKRLAEERLPGELTRRWRDVVTRHLDEHPITPEELNLLEERRDARARRSIEKDPHLAYGATLLCVLVTGSYIVYLQLGDGDILTVAADGDVTRPIRRDARLIANETTSLCMHDAWREVRVSFQTLFGPPPALILLSTDGYANSFVDDAAFRKVGSDILDILRTEGAAVVEDNLSTWLADASQAGSGDDISMGILFPAHILRTLEPSTPEGEAAKLVNAAATDEKTPVEEAVPPEDGTPEEAPTAEQPEDEVVVEAPAEAPPEGEKSSSTDRKPKIELIKDEDGPREPSKKLPSIFYDD